MFQKVARLGAADYLTIPRQLLAGLAGLGADTRWLLFCTHPLREAENTLAARARPYLTYYAFAEPAEGVAAAPSDVEVADAADVHAFLHAAEKQALSDGCSGAIDPEGIAAAKRAGLLLRTWIESVTRFGAASFTEAEQYFVPVPVALVNVIDT